VIVSLIETCKLLAVEPHAYLADVITRIVDGHPQSRLDDLLPWAYPAMQQFKAVA
jgi:transposase